MLEEETLALVQYFASLTNFFHLYEAVVLTGQQSFSHRSPALKRVQMQVSTNHHCETIRPFLSQLWSQKVRSMKNTFYAKMQTLCMKLLDC